MCVIVPPGLTTKREFLTPRRGNSLEMEVAALKLQVVPGQTGTPARYPGQPWMFEFCCLHIHVYPRNALPSAEVQLLIWIKYDTSLQQRDQH